MTESEHGNVQHEFDRFVEWPDLCDSMKYIAVCRCGAHERPAWTRVTARQYLTETHIEPLRKKG